MALLSSLLGGPLVAGVLSIIDKLIPDKDLKEKVKAELQILEQRGELEIMLSQIETNMAEAHHPSMFVAGWRPFVGWVCAISFGYHMLIVPIVMFIAATTGNPIPLPEFDISVLMTMLMGLLGIGGMRSYDKYRGTARDQWKPKPKEYKRVP